MYSYLSGIITARTPTEITLDVHGIGFRVFISLYTYAQLPTGANDQPHTLYIHEHIREDAHDLYGFCDTFERDIFTTLIKISGISVSTARMMLSSLSPQELYDAILRADVQALVRIKGIGKKTAERVVLELRDKLSKGVQTGAAASYTKAGDTAAIDVHDTRSDAVQALVALGVQRSAAESAVARAYEQGGAQDNVEQLIKRALQYL